MVNLYIFGHIVFSLCSSVCVQFSSIAGYVAYPSIRSHFAGISQSPKHFALPDPASARPCSAFAAPQLCPHSASHPFSRTLLWIHDQFIVPMA